MTGLFSERPAGGAAGPIDLSATPSFRLGPLEVRPSTREVRAADGALHVVEPRVMQVLVALALADGAVVSRDSLVARCWDGRIIGDDAINRPVAKVRKIADLSKPAAFAIDTIPRVGYRLRASEGAPPKDAAGEPRSVRLKPRLRALLIGLLSVAILTAAGAIGYRSYMDTPVASPVIAVLPFENLSSDRDTGRLARQVRDEVISVLDDNGLSVAPRSPIGLHTPAWARRSDAGSGPDLELQGQLLHDGDRADARITLRDKATGQAVWTSESGRPWRERAQLRQDLAATVNEAVQAAREPYRQPGLKIDPVTLGLHIRGVLAIEQPGVLRDVEAKLIMAEVVRRAPQFAAGHAYYAITLKPDCDPATAVGWRACDAARSEAERAIALYPAGAGAGYDALLQVRLLEHPTDLQGAETILRQGLAAAPSFPFLTMRACAFLVGLGRADEALPYCERAVALRPLGPPTNLRLAQALYAADEVTLSEQVYEEASRRAPDIDNLRRGLTEVAVFSGPPDQAAAILDDPARRSPTLTDDTLKALRLVLRARASGRPADIDAALGAVANTQQDPDTARHYEVMAAGLFNRPDMAFSALADAHPAVATGGGLLFLPVTETLRRDPRFWRLMTDRGVVRYWRTGNWPDFCRKPAFLAECRRRLGPVHHVEAKK